MVPQFTTGMHMNVSLCAHVTKSSPHTHTSSHGVTVGREHWEPAQAHDPVVALGDFILQFLDGHFSIATPFTVPCFPNATTS